MTSVCFFFLQAQAIAVGALVAAAVAVGILNYVSGDASGGLITDTRVASGLIISVAIIAIVTMIFFMVLSACNVTKESPTCNVVVSYSFYLRSP